MSLKARTRWSGGHLRMTGHNSLHLHFFLDERAVNVLNNLCGIFTLGSENDDEFFPQRSV